jgi:hypothetical protein
LLEAGIATFGFQNLLEGHFIGLNMYLKVIKVKLKVHPRTGHEDPEGE